MLVLAVAKGIRVARVARVARRRRKRIDRYLVYLIYLSCGWVGDGVCVWLCSTVESIKIIEAVNLESRQGKERQGRGLFLLLLLPPLETKSWARLGYDGSKEVMGHPFCPRQEYGKEAERVK